MRRNRENLRYLFGDVVASMASFVDVETLPVTPETIKRIGGMANKLMDKRGEQKRYFVNRLTFTDRLLLCIWLSGLGGGAKLMAAAYAHE